MFERGMLKEAEEVADKLISSDTPHQYWLARGFILYSDILRKEGKNSKQTNILNLSNQTIPAPRPTSSR